MWGLFASILEVLGISPIYPLAYALGTTIPALKMLISVLMGYPMAIFYEKYIKKQERFNRQLFFIASGLDLAWFNFGTDMYHSIITCSVMYATTMGIGPGKVNTIFTFAFNMIYLLWGYYDTESENYDITWTTPQCVISLKLIALSYDIWDGQQPIESLSANNKKTALNRLPTLLELLGYVYFPASFLIGPQFSMKRYLSYMNDEFPTENSSGSCSTYAFKRLLTGFAYLAAFQIGGSVFSQEYLLSDEFNADSFLYKHIFLGFWGRFLLYKYMSCWLLAEASCIRLGFAYQEGQEEDQWSGCTNIKLMRFESATTFGHCVEGFNVNTNYFVSQYIYKRLIFLGNRHISQAVTLLFLAVWHGLCSGYYMAFANEFFIMYMEKELQPMIEKTRFYNSIWSSQLQSILYTLLKLYTIVFMGWSLVPFDLKIFSKWWQVYSNLYFSGFILFVPWAFLYKPIVVNLIKMEKNNQRRED